MITLYTWIKLFNLKHANELQNEQVVKSNVNYLYYNTFIGA